MRDSHREFPVPWTKTGGQADEDSLSINSANIERLPKEEISKTIYLLSEEEKKISRVRRKILREGVN